MSNCTNTCKVLATYVEKYLEKKRTINIFNLTYANTTVKEMYNTMSPELRSELNDEIKSYKRCPDYQTLHELLMGNKSGLLYYKSDIRYKLLKDMYIYDASSYYPSVLLTNNQFPLGPLWRVPKENVNANTAWGLFHKGYWISAHLVSEEPIVFTAKSLVPHKADNEDKEHRGLYGYYKDELGYHYTVTPYDILLYRDFLHIDIFNDERFKLTGLAYCKVLGSINRHFAEFIANVYTQKEEAATASERDTYKSGLNFSIGKGAVRTLFNTKETKLWYSNPEHYICPQFSLHVYALARYQTMKMAYEIGWDSIDALVVDSIKTRNPKVHEVVNNFNKIQVQKSSLLNVPDLGKWKPEHAKYFIQFGEGQYVLETHDGKVKPVLVGCKRGKERILKFTDVFKDDVLPATKELPSYGLWCNSDTGEHYTEERLTAKEEYEKCNGKTLSKGSGPRRIKKL